jgi:hypothetical protein
LKTYYSILMTFFCVLIFLAIETIQCHSFYNFPFLIIHFHKILPVKKCCYYYEVWTKAILPRLEGDNCHHWYSHVHAPSILEVSFSRYWTYCLWSHDSSWKSGDLDFSIQNLAILGHYFLGKSSCIGENHIFPV